MTIEPTDRLAFERAFARRLGRDNVAVPVSARFGALTWAGLGLAAIGWGALLCAPLMAAATGPLPNANEVGDPVWIILRLGENGILSGLALAILGAMRHRPTAAAQAVADMPERNHAPVPAFAPLAASSLEIEPPSVVAQGDLAGRAYALYSDGSVVVETLLGQRRFQTLDDARQFIGS